jgi:hypothetical protein
MKILYFENKIINLHYLVKATYFIDEGTSKHKVEIILNTNSEHSKDIFEFACKNDAIELLDEIMDIACGFDIIGAEVEEVNNIQGCNEEGVGDQL